MDSRQYIPEAWSQFAISSDNRQIICNLNYAAEIGPHAPICLIPTQALNVVKDPVGLKEKPNVMSQWLDRLPASGCSILLMHGLVYDKLWTLAARAVKDIDGFSEMERRIAAVVSHVLEKQMAQPGKIVAMGSSRHGFAILHAMANNPDISAAVAHQPVIYWPKMKEFHGMEGNSLVQKHDIFQWVDEFSPRPCFVQTGYADQRIGQEVIDNLVNKLKSTYSRDKVENKFTHDLMNIPGHDGTLVPDSALDGVVPWLKVQGLIQN